METIISTLVGILIGAGLTYWSTYKQLKEMRKIQEDERRVAMRALLLELEDNSTYIEATLGFLQQGGHAGKQGTYTWTWNIPHTEAYEKYLVLACEGDLTLTETIVTIYSQIEAIKITTQYIHNLLANNLIECHTTPAKGALLAGEVTQRNKEIGNICTAIRNPVEELIRKLSDRLCL